MAGPLVESLWVCFLFFRQMKLSCFSHRLLPRTSKPFRDSSLVNGLPLIVAATFETPESLSSYASEGGRA